jgi:hypothetical protein
MDPLSGDPRVQKHLHSRNLQDMIFDDANFPHILDIVFPEQREERQGECGVHSDAFIKGSRTPGVLSGQEPWTRSEEVTCGRTRL